MKKILLTLIMGMILIASVSAWEFDNVKGYNPEEMKIDISNSFLGIPTTDVGSVRLVNYTGYCFVGDCYANYVLNNKEDNSLTFKGSKYFNLAKTIQYFRESKYEIYDETFEYEVDVYENVCKKTGKVVNGTKSIKCKDEKVGTEKKYGKWIDFNLNTKLPKGKYNLREKLDINEGETIEIIPNFYGLDLEEWADFTGLTKYENNTDIDVGGSYAVYNTYRYMFTFTVGTVGENVSFTLKGLNLSLVRNAYPDLCYFHLFPTNDSGSPDITGAPLSNGTYNISTISDDDNNPSWVSFFMEDYEVTQGETYSISPHCRVGGGNYLGVMAKGSDAYAGGMVHYTSDNGTAWVAYDYDGGFEVWGEIPDNNPEVTLNSPIDYYNTSSQSVTFNCSATDDYGVVNLSLMIDGIRNYTISNSTAGENLSLYTTQNFDFGDYNWSCESYDASVNQDSEANRTFSVKGFINELISFNETTYETSIETINLNITYNSTRFTSSSAILYYNGTGYIGTKIGSGDNISFSRTLDIGLENQVENKTFHWEVNLSDGSDNFFNSTFNNQTVHPIYFALCNATYTIPYINFTFKDESDDANIVASIPYSTFNYWLGDGTINKTLTFENTTANPNYTFCFSPPDEAINMDMYIQYKNTSSYPQRTYDPQTISLTNATTNEILYLLSSSDGLYVTFQVVNSADQPISDVSSNATRLIGGINTLVGQGLTGADGGVTFWLNPDFSHTFSFNKEDYDLYTTSLTPTQTSYTIVLGGGATTSNFSDYGQGLTYSILPDNTYLNNDTSYSFNFTISSTYWSLDNYGFNITNSSGNLIGEVSDTTGTGGTVNLDLDTASNSTFIIISYWTIEGNLTYISKSWIIIDTGESSWSIKYLIDDAVDYISDGGIYGLTIGFNTSLLAFIIIFVSVGALTISRGINNPSVLMGIIFAFVFFFDVNLGWLTLPSEIGAVAHFPTFVTFIIFAGFFLKEATK